jgi:hypothetical protein
MHFIILNNACLRACKKIHACIVKARVTTCGEDRSSVPACIVKARVTTCGEDRSSVYFATAKEDRSSVYFATAKRHAAER